MTTNDPSGERISDSLTPTSSDARCARDSQGARRARGSQPLTASRGARVSRPRTAAGFLALQVLLVSVAVAATSHRVYQLETDRALPAPRREPLAVTPLYDYPWVVSDEQLQRVLHKLRPRLDVEKPKINHVDHALRFWGVEAVFDDPECLAGTEMRRLLTDHASFAEAWGTDTQPLLIKTAHGVRVRMQEGNATASHVDHTLAGLAEVGTPSDYPIFTTAGQFDVRAILEHSLRTFSLNQIEYEWSTLAYALYLPPATRWISKEGQEITFDRLAERLMRQSLAQGVCMGNHRLYTLAVLLRVDDQQGILSPDTRTRIIDHLQDATARLVRHQHAYGYWDRNWPDAAPSESPDKSLTTDALTDRLLATGHALEWWAISPREAHPPREVLARAGQWLCQTIDQLEPSRVESGYPFLTHCGRALALWRGHFPSHFLSQHSPPETAEEVAKS